MTESHVPSAPLANALVLAGNRGGNDTIASLTGVSHKAMAPINGVPMLLRLWRCLMDCPAIGKIYVCIDDEELLAGVGELVEALQSGRLTVITPAASPAASVASALTEIGLDRPLLVTTADHPLLTPEMIDYFLAVAAEETEERDFVVALAELDVVRAAYPDAIRTGYRLGGKSYSGCNLFLARRPAATRLAAFWRRMERFRKKPWRLILAVGPFALLRFGCGWLSLDAAVRHLSRRTGVKIGVVEMPFAEAAIDVDKPADYALVTSILQQREGEANI
ncbi:MAG TPA: NTP transferase domain-containing protein [Dongiaceae bacterium]|nr:NTP transferase domain-containing protein [Dongiaceae bacterium]